MDWLSRYVAEVGGVRAVGGDTELTYRTPIERMLEEAAAAFGASADIRQEPGRIKSIGAPDFLIAAKGGGVIGYVECKKPGADLHKETTKAQVERYRALSDNILLTDSFRWLHLRGGRVAADVQLPMTKPGGQKREEMSALLRAFLTAEAGRVSDSKQLAAALAYRCAVLRKGLLNHEGKKESRLYKLLGEFKEALDRDLDYARFADIFAQTLVYSLLMAKLNAGDGEQLELDTARRHIPENFAVIRQITSFLPDMDDAAYKGIRWIVGDILAIINGMDKAAIAESMSYKKGARDGDDPYINFYEDFLAEYDAKLRKSRGVYYTPSPVVRFIVRATDDLLRREFQMPKGLAERGKVTALDFAAGTGTFMLEMARLLFDGRDKAKINMLARGHFLPNFHGFELMTSAYVISHLKLSRFLADNGVALQNGERIKVWLANTLDRADSQIELALMPALTREAKEAQEVKDSRILAIVGNPPYSIASQNRGKWITDLLHGIDNGKEVGGSYYQVDGNPLGETNPQAVQDDYVKFIRFAQRKMDMAERGIVAVITNHAFLDNPTFRGMRQSLLKTFNALYFLDLHGNANKQEKAPDGGRDENVFDIRQGTAITLMVKNPAAKKQRVFHADLWGTRKHKYAACESGGIDSVKWKAIKPASPYYFFAPFGKGGGWKQYRQHWGAPEIFATFGSGIKSHRDHFAFAFSADEMKSRVCDMANAAIDTAELRERYNLKDTRDWKLEAAREAIRDYDFDKFLKPCMLRPFDARHCYYGREIMELPRPEVMRQMLAGDNTGLITSRIVKDGGFRHVAAAENIIDGAFLSPTTASGTYMFPLYRYENGMGAAEKRENFTADFRRWIDARYGKAHKPEDILGCIYAVLHSPDYRLRYADFLRVEFPRIPFPKGNDEFKRLAAIGNELINAHLLREHCGGEYGELCGEGTSLRVEKARYDESSARLYFNKDEYFAPLPPEVFNFHIGGYKPIDKYIKSRKGRQLSADEVDNIEKAANAIAYTITKTGEIDG